MKRKLLITTAIAWVYTSLPAQAEDINITKDTKLTEDVIVTDGNINISAGDIVADDNDIEAYKGNINISGGTLTMGTDADIMAKQGKLTVTGGTINLNSDKDGASEMFGLNGVEIAGGTINVNSTGEGDGGGLIDTFYYNLSQDELTFEKPATSGDVIFSGGTVNIAENGRLNILTEGDIKLTDGEINVNKGGLFYVCSGATVGNVNNDNQYELSDYKNGTLNISDNGILNLSGKFIGNIAANNGGVVNVGESAAVIDGDAVFNSGSTLKISVTDNGNGSLTANKITGKSGSKLALNVTKNLELGESVDVTLLNGEISNNFGNEVSNSRYKVTKDGGKYTITYQNSASDVIAEEGGNTNNANTGEAWDTMAAESSATNVTVQKITESLRDLSQNDGKAYIEALTAVAPEVAPLVQKTQTETVNHVFSAVSLRLTGGSISSARQGIASGDNPFRKVAVWVHGLFNKSKLDDTKTAKGFDSDSYGAAFGVENTFDNHVRAGIGYAYTDTDIDGFKRDTDVDTHTAILYGEYKPTNWFVNGIASYGWSDYSEKKNVAGIGVKADYDVETLGLQAMTGYEFGYNGFSLTPEAGLRYVHISQDSYKDSAGQKVSGNDSDILTGVIGAKVSKDFVLNNGVILQPEFRLAATYDLKNDKAGATVTLANGSAYQVAGEALDRFGVEVGAGVTAALTDRIDVSLGYEGKFRDDYQDHTGLVNARYKF